MTRLGLSAAALLAALLPGAMPALAAELKLPLTCADGTRVLADFGARPGMLLLTIGDRRMLLRSLPSGSGVRYGSDDTVFWTKGNQARLIRDGNETQCRMAAPQPEDS